MCPPPGFLGWFPKVMHHGDQLFKGCAVCAKSLQSCQILCDPMDCSPPGSSVHGIFQARKLEWVVVLSSRESFWPRDRTCISCVSCISRWNLYHQHHLESLRQNPPCFVFILFGDLMGLRRGGKGTEPGLQGEVELSFHFKFCNNSSSFYLSLSQSLSVSLLHPIIGSNQWLKHVSDQMTKTRALCPAWQAAGSHWGLLQGHWLGFSREK